MSFGCLGLLGGGFGRAGASLGPTRPPSWVPDSSNPPDLYFDFKRNLTWVKLTRTSVSAASLLTLTRSSGGTATDLLPTSIAGASYSTFANNVPRITTNQGLLIEEARTNLLTSPTAPATQSVALTTGTHNLWVNGSGSAAVSAGTATITGAGSASNGSPVQFVVTVAGTVTVTVTGSLSVFQLEKGASPTSFAVGARGSEICTANVSIGTAASLFVKIKPLAPLAYGTTQPIADYDDTTASNRVILQRASGTGIPQCNSIVSGVSSGFSNTAIGSAIAQNVSSKLAVALAAGDQAADVNGGTIVTATGNIAAGLTKLRLGSNTAASSFANSVIESVGVWTNRRISNAELLSITF